MKKFESIQEACDYAMKAIVEQGCRSAGSSDLGTGCYYVHPDNSRLRCAIGHLFTNEEAMSIKEFMGDVSELKEVLRQGFCCGFSEYDLSFLEEHMPVLLALQDVHDNPLDSLKHIERYGINTSGSHWRQWQEMHRDM